MAKQRLIRWLLASLPVLCLLSGQGASPSSRAAAVDIPTPTVQTLSQSVWRRFQDPNGRFAVLMPGEPKQQQNVQDLGQLGRLAITAFSVEQPGLSVHIIAYTDLPASVVQSTTPTVLLDRGRNGLRQNVQGTLLSEKSITLNGSPGREITLKTSSNLMVYSRIYLVDRRIYQMIVVAPENKAANLAGSIQGFLQSFQLL